MGMLAAYMLIDKETLNGLMELNEEDLVERIEELEEDGADIYSMDKLWDGLHFLLTGVSANKPIEGDPLSEAIVGVHVFATEDDFVGCIEADELARIVSSLQSIDIKTLAAAADFAKFNKSNLYPDIWYNEAADNLRRELITEFEGIRTFYEKALEFGKCVIISIY